MNDNEKLVNAVLKDLDRKLTLRDLCKAVREASRHGWRPWPWAWRVTEEQERLDTLMREANLVKAGRVVNANV